MYIHFCCENIQRSNLILGDMGINMQKCPCLGAGMTKQIISWEKKKREKKEAFPYIYIKML